MSKKKTECQYCGHKLFYTNFDTEIKCYKCLTIHYTNGKEMTKKENLIYSMYPYMMKDLNIEKPIKKPCHNMHTV